MENKFKMTKDDNVFYAKRKLVDNIQPWPGAAEKS